MSNALSTYGYPVALTAILGLIVWGPTLFSFRRKRRNGETVTLRHVGVALLIELAVFVALTAGAPHVGLREPGGYLLAFALFVGAVGAHVFSSMKFKRDS